MHNLLYLPSTVLVYGPFLTCEWAIWDVAVGHFGHPRGPFWAWLWAVFALCAGRFSSWAVFIDSVVGKVVVS